ncbi:MAG: hypothetical protein ACYCOR_17440 [Acidobacteriaceae bacterium]
MIEATKPLKVPILRYPGGCFADTYHWQDGIGDRDKRPERWSDIWNEWEPNDFGFDDFMFFAHVLGFKPQITVNYMTGAKLLDFVAYRPVFDVIGDRMPILRPQLSHRGIG